MLVIEIDDLLLSAVSGDAVQMLARPDFSVLLSYRLCLLRDLLFLDFALGLELLNALLQHHHQDVGTRPGGICWIVSAAIVESCDQLCLAAWPGRLQLQRDRPQEPDHWKETTLSCSLISLATTQTRM